MSPWRRRPLWDAIRPHKHTDHVRLKELCAYLPPGAFIAGGFLTSTLAKRRPDGDIDLYFEHEVAATQARLLLDTPPDDATAWRAYQGPYWRGGNVADYKPIVGQPPIQCIAIRYGTPEEILDGFDMTVCQVATDGRDLIYNRRALHDIHHRLIILHDGKDSKPSLKRVQKYEERGYRAPGWVHALLALHKDDGEYK